MPLPVHRCGIAGKRYGLHRGMQVVPCGLVAVPDIPLVARAAPVVLCASLPAVEHRLELLVVAGTAQRQSILGPDVVLGHLPPASCQARCSVGHSEEDMQT